MRRRAALLFLALVAVLSLRAQSSTQGTEFWFTFMTNGYQFNGEEWVNNSVMISAKHACTGTIMEANATSGGIQFSVAANDIKTIEIPTNLAYNLDNEEQIDSKSLVLRTTDTVSVYICNIATYSFDASFVLPVESLSSEYIIQSDAQSRCNEYFPHMETSCFAIVAVEDNTTVDITTTVPTLHHPAGIQPAITLSKGQTYFVRSNNTEIIRDLSGSSVAARDGKRIAVFNGNTLTCIPDDVGNGFDHIFEQALPIESWGKKFVVTSSKDRVRDFVKVTSSRDNNEVSINGDPYVTLNRGESYEFDLFSDLGSCFIETSEPSMVYLYNTTCQEPYEPQENMAGDPSMVWIPPVEQRIQDITFCTFNHEDAPIDHHYVNVIVDKRDVDKVYLDDMRIPPHNFQPVIGNDDFYYTQKSISHDTHHLSCNSGLIAHVYGFGEAKGYAYCVGANVIDLNSLLYVNGLLSQTYHGGLFLCKGESANFKVETNYTITGVNWIFGDNQTAQGETVTHVFNQTGDFLVQACVQSFNISTQQPMFDTLQATIHVGETEYHNETHVLCDVDVFNYYGVDYNQSGHYERTGTNVFGCDSSYILTLDLGFTPYFEIAGDHWPIGGSETYISVNEYAIHFEDPRTVVDTILWKIDCDNWYLEPHGDGSSCTLYIFTFLQEPVTLHACAINRCDTVCEEFTIRTTYFGVDDLQEQPTVEECKVFNILGQPVQGFPDNPKLPQGIYILWMRHGNTIWTRKVALKR